MKALKSSVLCTVCSQYLLLLNNSVKGSVFFLLNLTSPLIKNLENHYSRSSFLSETGFYI